MNLILFNSSDIIADGCNYYAKLNDRQFTHCNDVIKVKTGDTLRVGVINHGSGLAIVQEVIDSSITVKLESPLHLADPVSAAPVVDIVFVIPRPKAFDRCIKNAVMLGVGKIILLCTDNVERAYLSSSHLTVANIKSCIISALEQCMDTRFPAVDIINSWHAFIDMLKSHRVYYSHIVVLEHTGSEDLSYITRHTSGSILLVLGPERGWRDFELDKFKSIGCHILSLGNRILTSTAAIAVSIGLINNALYNKTLRNGLAPAVRNADVENGNLILLDQS